MQNRRIEESISFVAQPCISYFQKSSDGFHSCNSRINKKNKSLISIKSLGTLKMFARSHFRIDSAPEKRSLFPIQISIDEEVGDPTLSKKLLPVIPDQKSNFFRVEFIKKFCVNRSKGAKSASNDVESSFQNF